VKIKAFSDSDYIVDWDTTRNEQGFNYINNALVS